jgi:hypothetical protein
LFREAFRTYQAQRARKILRESQAAFRGNNPSGYTAADCATASEGVSRRKTGQEKVIVVFDTNIWISALFFGGKPEQAILKAYEEDEIAICQQIADEI